MKQLATFNVDQPKIRFWPSSSGHIQTASEAVRNFLCLAKKDQDGVLSEEEIATMVQSGETENKGKAEVRQSWGVKHGCETRDHKKVVTMVNKPMLGW